MADVPTMIWIVISELGYYPSGGIADWRCVTDDHEQALEEFADASGEYVTLVRIYRDELGATRRTIEDYRAR